jgi:hypothetical protein
MFDLIGGYPMTINMVVPLLMKGSLKDLFKRLLVSPIATLIKEKEKERKRIIE